MSCLCINGGRKIEGVVMISGAKNAALPIIAATLIKGREYILGNIPNIEDVRIMLDIIAMLGCKVNYSDNICYIDSRGLNSYTIERIYSEKLRSSIIFLGPLLGRTKYATISYPGGCNIGARPIDIHLEGLRKFGVNVEEEKEYLTCAGENTHCAEITLSYPSVGATENLIMLAVAQKGVTRLINPAIEPEIIDLINFLRKCGYNIDVMPNAEILVHGGNEYVDNSLVEYTIIPDRIEAGTFIALATSVNSKICIENADKNHLGKVIDIYRKAGCLIDKVEKSIYIVSKERPKGVSGIKTMPYPGFPTDLQTPFVASMAMANGISSIRETVFENRYRQVEDLVKMGANISIRDTLAIITGVDRLHGERVFAKDLRGGAALIVAAAGAEGKTVIQNLEHVNRGYENILHKLQNLGVDAYLCDW